MLHVGGIYGKYDVIPSKIYRNYACIVYHLQVGTRIITDYMFNYSV